MSDPRAGGPEPSGAAAGAPPGIDGWRHPPVPHGTGERDAAGRVPWQRPAVGPDAAAGAADDKPRSGATAASPPSLTRFSQVAGQVASSPEAAGVAGVAGVAGPPPQPATAHEQLMSLLGAWALEACPPQEAAHVECHLNDCATCADEALRLRHAATLLEPRRSLDLDPGLRPRVLEACLARRVPRLPVPSWAAPYDAETARLDALLTDFTTEEWRTPVPLRWYSGGVWAKRDTTVAGVLDHLLAVDGLLARAVGLPDPLAGPHRAADAGPMERTLRRWDLAGAPGGHGGHGERGSGQEPDQDRGWSQEGHGAGATARGPWREQSRELVRAAARTGGRTGEHTLPLARYGDPGLFPGGVGDCELSLSDAYLSRAFACWVHADDIAQAVSYPYEPPLPSHLRLLVDLTARRLPGSIADRRRAGLATLAGRLTPADKPGRTLHLEIEGEAGGDFYIPLDSPAATVSRAAARQAVAHVALDDVLFCQLASGRITPEEAAEGAGTEGDAAAVHDVLFAAADLSRL